ncbi:39S mitochondrial ribosomal protein L46-domain-containing protein [Lophiotrema nucula]|uniref:Large ribosomal subunit protein mL46 n=1 Tax=Lophiotrema nucula TaxID=690887 RepID=A0A6A5YZG6_9PLEO|nr:39S mitochondrial ribosomal protein L46-domain-containing protein [Lophiotrema nucula]
MNAGQKTTRRLASRAGHSICRSCLSHRTYASSATAAAPAEEPTPSYSVPIQSSKPQTSYAVNAGILVSRPPLLTRDLHPFESAYFLYQRRLNERLALPFTRYFYVKKNTPADLEWKRKMKQRLTPARDIGKYNGYNDESWNDELLVGAQESEVGWQVERLLEDAEQSGVEETAKGEGVGGVEVVPPTVGGAKKVEHEPVERPMPRVTEADRRGDVKSLDRALQRTLYLLVKNREGRWGFPEARLIGKESLHNAAERVIIQSAGLNMNTWVIGNVPIGHHEHKHLPEYLQKAENQKELGLKTFFMKVRIMAGQADLKDNKLGLTDFKWLAKEEIEKSVEERYWKSVKNMLAER